MRGTGALHAALEKCGRGVFTNAEDIGGCHPELNSTACTAVVHGRA